MSTGRHLEMVAVSFQTASRAVVDSDPTDLDSAHLMKAIASALDFARVAMRALEAQLPAPAPDPSDDMMVVAHALQVERFRAPARRPR